MGVLNNAEKQTRTCPVGRYQAKSNHVLSSKVLAGSNAAKGMVQISWAQAQHPSLEPLLLRQTEVQA